MAARISSLIVSRVGTTRSSSQQPLPLELTIAAYRPLRSAAIAPHEPVGAGRKGCVERHTALAVGGTWPTVGDMVAAHQLLVGCSLVVTGVGSNQEASETPAPNTRGREVVVDTFSKELPGGPGGLAIDARGFVYCADFGAKLGGGPPGSRIYKLDPRTGEATVFVEGMQGASGNAFGPDGALFQSNIAGGFITRIDPGGESRVFLTDQLRSPVGIAIDETGTLLVANCGSNTILECTPEGEASVFCSSPLLSCPNGIALGPVGEVYVSNFNNGDVIKVAIDGTASKLATLPGKNNGHLMYHDDSLLVVARGAHQIFRVSLEGEAELFAGSGKRGRDDGPALEATFSYPNDIAVSPDGTTLYVNENGSTTKPHTELAPIVVRRIRLREGNGH